MSPNNSTLAGLKEEERQTRRNLIIDAAIRQFADKSFNQVGMRDIAAEAGLSPASIYRYFADRDDLFVEALSREMAAIERDLRRIMTDAPDSSIETVAGSYVGYLMEHGVFLEMMTHFMIHGGIRDDALERFNATERRFLGIFDEMFTNMGTQGNVRLLSHTFLAAMNGILVTFRNYPGRSEEETGKHVHRLAVLTASVYRKGVG